jgi:thymidylate kinase
VLDRWALSAIVYGNCGGANKTFVNFLDCFLFNPRGMVVLCGRSHVQGTDDVYELDNEFQGQVREFYKIISSDYHACERVNASQTREKVHDEILKYFDLYCRGV